MLPLCQEKDKVMNPALELRGLSMSFGALSIMQDVFLSVAKGERHAVIGPNGAGKSTLFHLISGHLVPTAGSIHLDGSDITGCPPHQIFAAGLARNFQVNCLFPTMTARENLRCATLFDSGHHRALWRRAATLPDVNEKVAAMLDAIQLGRRADIACESLSYSEQRALEIGMAAISGRSVILLDEPTAGMSHAETDQFVALIHTLTKGRTLLVVEHDMGVVFSLADRITVLASGRIVATDTPALIRANEEVQTAYLGDHAPSGEGKVASC